MTFSPFQLLAFRRCYGVHNYGRPTTHLLNGLWSQLLQPVLRHQNNEGIPSLFHYFHTSTGSASFGRDRKVYKQGAQEEGDNKEAENEEQEEFKKETEKENEAKNETENTQQQQQQPKMSKKKAKKLESMRARKDFLEREEKLNRSSIRRIYSKAVGGRFRNVYANKPLLLRLDAGLPNVLISASGDVIDPTEKPPPPEQVTEIDLEAEEKKRADRKKLYVLQSNRSFVDYLQVKVKAGKGGDGKVSFRSAIYVEFGGPDGGDGGNGGNVILRANPSYTSLIHISKLLKGEPGENGKGAERHGMSGKDTIVNVPVGTCVFEQVAESKILSGNRSNSSSSSRSNGTSDTVDINEDISKAKSIKYKDKKQKRNSTANDDSNNVDNHESNNNNNSNNLAKSAISSSNINSGNNNNNSNGSNEMSDNNNNNQNTNSLRNTSDAKVLKAIIDLDTPGSEIVIARGGRKGLGNRRFRSSTNQAPNVASPGEEGEEKTIVLELKTIADIGLVGCPNAGKSTLLGAVSNAHPQVAAYPFTTLNPFVGVIEFSDLFRMTMADIPGLVAGAHANKGLGHSFLRHIERSKVLVYIVDTAGVDGRKPWDDLAVLERELELFSPGLSKGLSWRAVQSVDSNGSTNSGNSNSSSGSNNSRVLVVANKMDLPEAQANYPKLKRVAQSKKMNIIPISAKDGVDKIGLLTTTLRSMVESIRKEEQELKLKKQREAKMREKEDKTRAQKQSTTKLQPGKEEKEEGDLDEEAVAYNNFIKSLGFTDRNDRKKRKNSKRRAQMFAHGYSGSQ